MTKQLLKTKKSKTKSKLYLLLLNLAKLVYKKRKLINFNSSQVCIYVGNHCQLHSPIDFELSFPQKKKIWCISEVMNFRSAPNYMVNELTKHKGKKVRWFYKMLSYFFCPLLTFILNNADTIPVYKDSRISQTFNSSLNALEKGESIIIFPECHKKYNNIICEFEKNFVFLAKLFYKKTGKSICFIPFYNSPKLKTIIFGSPIEYNPKVNLNEQKQSICTYLMESITSLARSLPTHTVIPYENVNKKFYPKSN